MTKGNILALGPYRWIDKHDMPAHRMGRLWKFKKDEVGDWVRAG